MLRERREDVLPLARSFLGAERRVLRLSRGTEELRRLERTTPTTPRTAAPP